MTEVDVVTLLYHAIYDDRDTHEFYDIAVSTFEGHLQAIRMEGLECITASDLVESGGDGSNARSGLLLTFDDGKISHHKVVFPILEGRSLRATFFVIPERVGKKGYLSWHQLREMDRRGMSIQSHGLTHRFLHNIPKRELDQELRDSKAEIEQQIGRRVEFLSFPEGFYSKLAVETAWDHGFRGVFTSDPGFDHIRRPAKSVQLHRCNVARSTTPEEITRLIGRSWRLRLTLQGMQAIKNGIRNVIGTSAYQWAWKKLRKFTP